jgi:hypothetical protein
MGLLQQTAEPARQILDVETIDVVADKGYFKSEMAKRKTAFEAALARYVKLKKRKSRAPRASKKVTLPHRGGSRGHRQEPRLVAGLHGGCEAG